MTRKVTIQQSAYHALSFVAEVGRFVGMLLGISVHLLDYVPVHFIK